MKKASMETLINYIDTHNLTDLFPIKDELTAELSKGKAKAEANRQAYADLHDKVMTVLAMSTSGVTAQEIADEIGAARGKVVYGLNGYWEDEVERDSSGKTTLYRLRR